MYFYYQRNALGKWCPQTSPDSPETKKAEGKQVKLRQVMELPEADQHFNLTMLARLYPLKELDINSDT